MLSLDKPKLKPRAFAVLFLPPVETGQRSFKIISSFETEACSMGSGKTNFIPFIF